MAKGMIVNRSGLAEAFGVGLNTVDAWVRDDCPILKRGSRGVPAEFNTADVSRWLQDRARADAGGTEKADAAEIERRTGQAKMLQAELALAKARGEVAPVRDFERAMAKLCAEIRSRVMNVPQRVVTQLLGETDETTFKQRLRKELGQALEVVANAELTLAEDAETEDAEQ